MWTEPASRDFNVFTLLTSSSLPLCLCCAASERQCWLHAGCGSAKRQRAPLPCRTVWHMGPSLFHGLPLTHFCLPLMQTG